MAQLCTKAQVKLRLGIVTVTDDALIDEIIDQVSAAIEHFTQRKLTAEAAATYVLDTAIGHELAIPRGIRTVTAMGVASTDQPDAGGTYQAVTLATILLRPSPIARRPGWPATTLLLTSSPIDTRIPFRTAANGATITGDFGFATTPAEVARIAIGAAVMDYNDRRKGQAGAAGAEGVELPRLLGVEDLATLARYRPPGGIG